MTAGATTVPPVELRPAKPSRHPRHARPARAAPRIDRRRHPQPPWYLPPPRRRKVAEPHLTLASGVCFFALRSSFVNVITLEKICNILARAATPNSAPTSLLVPEPCQAASTLTHGCGVHRPTTPCLQANLCIKMAVRWAPPREPRIQAPPCLQMLRAGTKCWRSCLHRRASFQSLSTKPCCKL